MKNELPKRKNLRLQHFDYSTPGAYFITFCTFNRENTLSDIVCDIHGDSADRLPENKLTEYGKIIERIITELPATLGAKIDRYVIMPNHVHLIIVVDSIRAIRESPLQPRSVISKAVGYIKMNASKAIKKEFGASHVWQRGFHDHIIRDQEDYTKIAEYIFYNPLKWQYDSLNSDRVEQ